MDEGLQVAGWDADETWAIAMPACLRLFPLREPHQRAGAGAKSPLQGRLPAGDAVEKAPVPLLGNSDDIVVDCVTYQQQDSIARASQEDPNISKGVSGGNGAALGPV